MAGGTGFGYGIDISALDKSIVAADAHLKGLATTAEKTMGRINNAFAKGVSGGISMFIKEISKANSELVQLSQKGIGFEFNPLSSGKGSNFYASVMNDVNKIMSQTRKELEDLNKYKLKDIIDPRTSLNSIKQLEARLQMLQTSLSTGKVGGRAIGSNQRKAYADEIAAIQERLKVLRMSTAEFNRLKSEEAAALLRNAQVEEETNARRIKEQQRFLQEQRRQATERAKAGDTTAHALKYTDRIFSDKGLRSINNMNRAISMMQDAQRKLNLNTEDGRQKYAQLETRIRQAKKAIDEATGSSNKLKKAHTSLMDISGQLARKMALVFSVSQITGYIRKLVEVRGEFELQQKALQAIVQNVDEANKLWDKTVALAVRSPFRVKELVTYTKQLAAYRVETDKLYDTTKMLADVSAGLGVDMQRLILAYGQVKAANYLRGTELRQFSEAGINILGELAKYFTELEGRVISVGDVFERVSKRMVTFGDVEEIFRRITSEGGVFYNMQELQAETVKGQMSNLRDSIDIMLNDIGKANDGTIKGLIKAARNVVENWEEFAVTLKAIVPLFLALHAQSKLSAIGLKNAGDASLWFHKGLNTTVGAASKATLSLKGLTFQQKLYATASFLGIKATAALQTALIGLGSVLKTIAPFLIVAALVEIYKAMTKASREAKRLQKSLDGIFAEDTSKLNASIDRYGDLVTRLREANAGSKERRDIISKLNNEYGQYLDFVVTEQTSVDKLADSYDILVKRMKEKAAINTYEKGAQEIEDSYGKALKNAKEEFYELFEGGSVRMKGNDLSAAFKTIIPTKDEIDDIYSLLQQKINSLSSEQMDSLGEQQQLIQGIVAGYYGEEFFLSRDYAKSIELINILVDKKRLEEELQSEINAQYKQTLKSRKANLAFAKLEQDYKLQQNKIRATEGLSDFEIQKRLNKIKEEFELNKIKLQFEFGAISKKKFNEKRNALLNWASDTTKDINNEIRRNLSNFMSEEEWSAFLITPNRQSQGMSEIIKEITDGYASQTSEIERQLSLKSAGRKYDEKGLEFAQKQAKAYEVIADIMGIELKKQERMSEALREQINELLPTKHKISLEDAYKGVKDIQKETSNEYKAQVEVIEMLIAQKRAGIVIDGESLETAREDLEILREKMKLLGMKVDEPMSETTRNSINYFLPEEFKISEAEALKGIVAVNSEAASAFEKAQKEYDVLIKMQDQQVEGLEDEILLLESQLPYLQRKVELTGTEIKDRLSELQLLEINAQLSEEYQLDEINLYKDRSTLISEIQSKEQSVADAIRTAKEMRKEGLTIEDGYIEKLEEEYLAHKAILDLIDPSTEEPIDPQKMYDINAKLDKDYWIDVIDSQKNEVTLLRDANTEKEKAIAYEAQLLAMQKQGITVTEEQLALAKKDVEQWTLRWKLLGGTDDEKKTRSESLMNERIKVVDDMNKAYKDLNQTLSKTESLEGAFAKYKDAFQKAYAGTTLLPKNFGKMTAEQFIKEFNFTTEDGMVGFFDKLIAYAKKTSERVDVELAKGDYIMETRVEFKKGEDEKLLEDIQKLFDQYDLSLDIKKLNIPPDLAKSLFDVDYLDLSGLRTAVQAQESKFIGTDMEKEYRDFLKKIEELSRKQREDEAKEFVNFLKKNLNEIQVIQDKGAYNIALADRLFGEGKITSQQYLSSIRQIVDDTNKEVAKINLEKFKESSIYIKAMGNLAAYSKGELEGMIDALQGQVGANAGNMSVDEIKAYYEAIENLVGQYDKLSSPFEGGEISDLVEYIRLQKKLNKEKEREVALEQKRAAIELKIKTLEATLEAQVKRGDAIGASSTRGEIKQTVAELGNVNNQLAGVATNMSLISQEITNLGGDMNQSLFIAEKIVNQISNIANAATKMFENFKEVYEALGVDTEGEGWAKADAAAEMISGVSSELSSTISSLKDLDYAGVAAGITGMISEIIVGFSKIKDLEHQTIINEQMKKVERLSKAYEKLEKATEEAFSIEHLQQANEELKRNVELQIMAYEAAIAAEQAKKKTDQDAIDDYNEKIEDLTNSLDELTTSLAEGVGGLSESEFRSQTRGFVDAWVSAFKETGNGLSGLEDNFRDFFDDVIAEQAALRVTEKYLEPFYKSLNTALNDYELTADESQNLREEADKIMPELSKALELIWTQLGGSQGGTGENLSSLQKGIQGLTEDTGQIIESYLNSVRFYVESISRDIASQLVEVKAMHKLLDSVTMAGHPKGRSGIKVFID